MLQPRPKPRTSCGDLHSIGTNQGSAELFLDFNIELVQLGFVAMPQRKVSFTDSLRCGAA